MTASTSISVFHQWLLAEPASKASACAILLHCDDTTPYELLIQGIADYLNEYDDDGDGCWLPATPDLVRQISCDAHHRRLLGIPGHATDDPQAEDRYTLTGLGQRGHVVFRSPDAATDDILLAHTFHAAIGNPATLTDQCHLFLNSALLDQKCIAHIIGDVFLEWLRCDLRRGGPLHEIR